MLIYDELFVLIKAAFLTETYCNDFYNIIQ